MTADGNGWNDYSLISQTVEHGGAKNNHELLLSILLANGLQLQVATMKVRCAICGFTTIVIVPYDWRIGRDRAPDIWFCDEHRAEWAV